MKISLVFKDSGKVRTAVVVRDLLCMEAPGPGFPGLPRRAVASGEGGATSPVCWHVCTYPPGNPRYVTGS